MYQTTCAAAGVCSEIDRSDPLISHEPSSLPIEHDYSGFDIVKATQYGAINRVRELVDAGFDVNQPDSETVTLLHWAAINNRREIIAYLLEKGAIVDAVGGELNATPLHWATRQGHLGGCVQLMQSGADPSLRDAEGCSCIHLAAQFGHTALVAYFIARGVNPDLQDRSGMTALMWVSKISRQFLAIFNDFFGFLGSLESSSPRSSSSSSHPRRKSLANGLNACKHSPPLGYFSTQQHRHQYSRG